VTGRWHRHRRHFTDLVAIHAGTGERVTRKVLNDASESLVGCCARSTCSSRDALAHRRRRRGDPRDHARDQHAARSAGREGCASSQRGFRDILETGARSLRPLDLQIDLQRADRARLRIGVDERTGRAARFVSALDVVARAAIGRLRGRRGVAVCLLHSYATRARAGDGELLARLRPSVYACLQRSARSSARYERFTATAINAYVGPRCRPTRASRSLAARGFSGFTAS